MDSLLSPGMRLLGRFGFARKFQLLFLLFMLPLVGSLWMIGSEYRSKLAVIAGEQSGVRQLLVLEDLDRELVAQRNRAARWKAVDILREPTPEARQIMEQIDAAVPRLNQALERLGHSLNTEKASADTQARFKTLQAAVTGMDSQSLRSVGWWPDGYERFTAAISHLQAVREQVAIDSGLILDPWLESYLLMQLSTQQTPDLIERIGRMASVGQTCCCSRRCTCLPACKLRSAAVPAVSPPWPSRCAMATCASRCRYRAATNWLPSARRST